MAAAIPAPEVAAMPRIPLPPYPNGWFALALSSELQSAAVITRHALGRDFVLYRGEDGQARTVDAHCPHLGAHLGNGGRVRGNAIQCPFHSWCFDGTHGHCVEIPYARKIPPKARIGTWPTLERNGLVFVYHHVEGVAPTWEPQTIPELTDPNYVLHGTREWTIRSHPQEIMENGVDFAHFSTLHGWKTANCHWEPDGPFYRLRIDVDSTAEEQAATAANATDVDSFNSGPGFLFTRVRGAMDGIAVNALTPIEPERVRILHTYHAHRRVDPEMVKGFFEAYAADWLLDLPIWDHKIYRPRPALTEGEGDFVRFRKWYAQFYSQPTNA
jgi:phenylpropionate dioxygenase-like ring-hydroxylating dioxygenase large terminal subunit